MIDITRQNDFERFYERENPWNYDKSLYEHFKYQQTIEMLPQKHFNRILEIGCSEGYFTQKLADYGNYIVGMDISKTALKRARKRLSDYNNVHLIHDDIIGTPKIDGYYDLVVCSETLYYTQNVDVLKQVLNKISNALGEKKLLLSTHLHSIVDSPQNTGFTWELPLGVDSISKAITETKDLHIVKHYKTPLYDIILAQKHGNSKTEIINDTPYIPLTSRLLSHIKWEKDYTAFLPILMYHNVSSGEPRRFNVIPESFEEQLKYLKDNGYYCVSLDKWYESILTRTPIKDKGICITFDDGYFNFYEYAWPLLEKYGFTATMFVVTNNIGKTNSWDIKSLADVPQPLLSREHIIELSKSGITFGSHTHTHPNLKTLTNQQVELEMLMSKNILEDLLDCNVTTLCYPYTISDPNIQELVIKCGYMNAVSGGQISNFVDPLYSLSRVEISGNDNIEDFKKKIEVK